MNKYNDADLGEFKILIENKMARAKNELAYYREQINEVTETVNEEHDDWSEGAAAMSDLEFLNDLAHRQKKFVRDLENALIRIKNKTFGICELTGELIDKRRLMAVPTTTKSLVAKMQQQKEESKTAEPTEKEKRNTDEDLE
jgi:RNA polymerase-binding transcription factor DksA